MQTTYLDNAVLDVIGIPDDTINAPSALWRLKFYPDYPDLVNFPSGTRWDNNISYDTVVPVEVMEDIICTDNYVVTASHMVGDDRVVLVRVSNKETTLTPNGLELNDMVYALQLSQLRINGNLLSHEYDSRFQLPIRMCELSGNEFAITYNLTNTSAGMLGTLTFRHDASEATTSLSGVYAANR